MELFSPEFFSALLAIIVIDLVLAGDNAIVIAMAARNLPPHLQKKAIIWGAVGAIAVRSAMTLVVVYLLKIPGLMLIGGLLLVWIAYRLLKPEQEDGAGGDHASTSFWGAMRTIVIAVKADGDSVLFSIRDTGVGVPAEFKQNLFELLSTTKQTGMGLGLWLCKHIVTRYEGSIWHEDAEGSGAQFHFRLPRAI